MNKLRVIELFGGIGACTSALKNIGLDLDVLDYVEIDKYATQSYNAINDTSFKPQDISEWDKMFENVDLITHGSPCTDYSIAGTQQGGDEGSNTRSSLMWETIRIIEKIKPKFVLWENVKNVLSAKHRHNFEKYLNKMNDLNYNNYYKVLNGKDYGIPQNRERIFCISIRIDVDKRYEFPDKIESDLRLKDFLEDKVDEKYYLSEEYLERFLKSNLKMDNEIKILGTTVNPKAEGTNSRHWVHSTEGIIGTIDATTYKQPKQILVKEATRQGYAVAEVGDSINLEHPNSKTRRGRVGKEVAQTLTCSCNQATIVAMRGRYNDEGEIEQQLESRKDGLTNTLTTVQKDNLLLNNFRIRKLTPLECWKLMGFKLEQFMKAKKAGLSDSQLYKMAGNSIIVNVLEEIFKKLFF